MSAIDTMAQDLEALRRERDEWKARKENWEENANQWSRDWHDLRDERDAERERADALAAHVEILECIINRSHLVDDNHVMSALNSTPTTSLARRDANVAEEALRRAHEKLSERKEWSAAHHLLLVASEINTQFRLQAEGGES